MLVQAFEGRIDIRDLGNFPIRQRCLDFLVLGFCPPISQMGRRLGQVARAFQLPFSSIGLRAIEVAQCAFPLLDEPLVQVFPLRFAQHAPSGRLFGVPVSLRLVIQLDDW